MMSRAGRGSRLGALAIAALTLPMCLAAGSARAQIGGCTPDLTGSVFVELETSLGTIPIELFPNTAPLTVQNFLTTSEPDAERQVQIEATMKFLEHVVRDEDYFTGKRVQKFLTQ